MPADSPAKTLADLKGKKIGVAKGSSAHNLLVVGARERGHRLERHQARLSRARRRRVGVRARLDRRLVDLGPVLRDRRTEAEGAAAADRSRRRRSRTVFSSPTAISSRKHAEVVGDDQRRGRQGDGLGGSTSRRGRALFSEASGVDIAAQKRAVGARRIRLRADDRHGHRQQQAVADRFQRLGLIPAPIAVSDIVWIWKPNA